MCVLVASILIYLEDFPSFLPRAYHPFTACFLYQQLHARMCMHTRPLSRKRPQPPCTFKSLNAVTTVNTTALHVFLNPKVNPPRPHPPLPIFFFPIPPLPPSFVSSPLAPPRLTPTDMDLLLPGSVDNTAKLNWTYEVAEGCERTDFLLWGKDAQWFADHDFCALDFPTIPAWIFGFAVREIQLTPVSLSQLPSLSFCASSMFSCNWSTHLHVPLFVSL